MENKPNYSLMMNELEEIVNSLNRDDCPVDQLEELVGKASVLIKTLRETLSATERTVGALLEEIGG